MLGKKMEKALNEQINAELYSAYLYLSMATWVEDEGLDGFGNWFKVQAQEEVSHAMRLYDYVYERGGRVRMTQIEAPKTDWKSPEAAFEDTLEHEQKVTALINDLVSLARKESDYATENMLQWFVAEQVEEEDTAGKLLQRVKLVGSKGHGLYMMDRELAARVFTPPAAEEE
ncbi:MAG: ferritin [Candidatus Eisenbacteria bacterium]|nr:ferritin [Candidatus Eisenbacteria bacterium]